MNGIYAFFFGLIVTMVFVTAALIYLHPNLRIILKELCGTAERARFWTAFSNITLFLTPLIFALHSQPSNGAPSVLIYEASGQIASALLGLVTALMILGVVIGRFISIGCRPVVPATNATGQQPQR